MKGTEKSIAIYAACAILGVMLTTIAFGQCWDVEWTDCPGYETMDPEEWADWCEEEGMVDCNFDNIRWAQTAETKTAAEQDEPGVELTDSFCAAYVICTTWEDGGWTTDKCWDPGDPEQEIEYFLRDCIGYS